jgi:CspA family cold shock protein
MSHEDKPTVVSTNENTIHHADPMNPTIPADYIVIVERLTGTVKWFNNKAGFGFITVCEDGEYEGKDIFVHYSSIRVSNSQYKYLVQGEYVDFTLVKANTDTHEFQAMNVCGVKGGPIMCETRRSSNTFANGGAPSAPHYRRAAAGGRSREDAPPRRNERPERSQGKPTATEASAPTGGPRGHDDADLGDFIQVGKKKKRAPPSRAPTAR